MTPLHHGFANAVKLELNVTTDRKGKTFAPFGLTADVYIDYDLIYIANNMLFNGSKNVDGKPLTNRKTDRPICRYL